jgi:type II secretory pathway pseudopilin PulG
MLSSVVLVGLGSFRSRGRDARRVADLREVQNALELYYAKNGSYPVGNNVNVSALGLQSAGIGITKVPTDPTNSGEYYYRYGTDNQQGYVLGAKLEEVSAAVLNDDVDGIVHGVNCDDGDNRVYCIQF